MRLCPECSAFIDEPSTISSDRVYEVLAAVELVTAVPPSAVLSPRSHDRVVEARVAAARVLRDRYNLSRGELEEVFDRDGSTVNRWMDDARFEGAGWVAGEVEKHLRARAARGVQQELGEVT